MLLLACVFLWDFSFSVSTGKRKRGRETEGKMETEKTEARQLSFLLLPSFLLIHVLQFCFEKEIIMKNNCGSEKTKKTWQSSFLLILNPDIY